jgi:hypothetical protein
LSLPPRWRLPLLVLGFASLAFGIAGGLARLTPALAAPSGAIALHGALMVSGFFGTVIALERAVALGSLWAYGAPLAAGLGGVLLVLGLHAPGAALLVLAAALLVAEGALLLARQRSLEMAALLAGAAAWLAGNASFAAGGFAAPWWIAFFALTIGGERLELSRYLRRGLWARGSFAAIALGMLPAALEPRALGMLLVLLALWLAAFDLARVTVRAERLPRYIALCLLAALRLLGAFGGPQRLAVFGAWSNALAIALFIVMAASLVLRARRKQAV